MQVHDAIKATEADVLPAVDQALRLPLLCRVAHTTFAAIERSSALTRGSVSNYVGGRGYAYPRLQQAVVDHLASRLGRDLEEVRAYLFPDS